MSDVKFILNCSEEIDWHNIIKQISYKSGKEISPSGGNWNLKNPEYLKIYNLWKDARFNMSSIKWTNYYAEVDYPDEIIRIFEQALNVTHIRSWISRIDPGYCAAWHWDVDDHEEEYLQLGEIKRFVCHIGNKDPGHVFVLEDTCQHNIQNGDVFQWSNYRAWHGGMNCGLTSKFMFNFLGYDRRKISS
jgi:hypothetical protein